MTDTEEFILQHRYAIIGASDDRSKFGNIVLRNLRDKGYTVYPVNPRLKEIEGEKCYPNVASLPGPVDGIVTVVPPAVTERVVREAAEAGITRVWMQEGSESRTAITFCRENGMKVIYGQCIMVVANYRQAWEKQKNT